MLDHSVARSGALALAFGVFMATTPALAGTVATPNTFTNGTPAEAAEVNANFDAHETEINDNATEIANNAASVFSAQSDLAALAARVTALENSAATAVSLIVSGDGTIQVSSDAGVTVTRTGLGSYQIVIPAGRFGSLGGVLFGIPTITPISGTAELSSAFTNIASPSGIITQTFSFRNDLGTLVDTTFHIVFTGPVP